MNGRRSALFVHRRGAGLALVALLSGALIVASGVRPRSLTAAAGPGAGVVRAGSATANGAVTPSSAMAGPPSATAVTATATGSMATAVGTTGATATAVGMTGATTTLEWPTYGGDPGGSRYSPAATINATNVASLRLAWSFHTGVDPQKPSFESTPVIAAGRLFITTGDDGIFALDAASGRPLWRSTLSLAAGAVLTGRNRGVAYGAGQVYLATADDRLVAYDAATGRRAWQQQLVAPNHKYFESMAPLFDRGRVIVGVSGGEQEVRGFVDAYDARTGRKLWRFWTVPAPSDPGGNTWPRNGRYLRGGGSVWMTPVVDPALNLLYVCVTNPEPDANGHPRPGSNLYSDSIVALSADSGRVAWYFQEVHHDLWDFDPASPPVLLTLRLHGADVPAVIEAGKTGYLYVLDRRNGRPLVPTPERPVPRGPAWQLASPTQPEPRNQPFVPLCPAPGLYPREACVFTPPSETPVLMAPGGIGGSAWSPVSYSPRTGLAYIAATTYPMLRSTTPASCCFGRAPRPLPSVPPKGELVGYDVAAGRVAWRASLPNHALAFGGSAVTAGDIVFSGESAGYVDAHDARSGRLLWQYHSVAGADAAPAVYVAGGREYVAIAAGGNGVLDSPRGDSLDVFVLP